MIEILKYPFGRSRAQMNSYSSIQAQTLAARSAKFNLIFRYFLGDTGGTSLQIPGFIGSLQNTVGIMLLLAFLLGGLAGCEVKRRTPPPPAAEARFPDLRDAHDPKLQKVIDAALVSRYPGFRSAVKKKTFSIVVADVTDLHHPKVAWYNPNLMLYAASLPKIAIVLGVFVEIERGAIKLDSTTRNQLIRTVRHSSNQDASALLHKVGIERLAEILQDERYGKLYDPARGGGLWVGKEYGKAPAWRRDPLHGISHGASAMQAARFYYGVMNGTIIDAKYLPDFKEIFGEPAIKHKFVKGLKGRKDVDIYRKSGTWRDYHSDSAVVARDNLVYIVVYIDNHPAAGRAAVEGIRIVDDVMLAYANRSR
jgi:beta-lactamase class A